MIKPAETYDQPLRRKLLARLQEYLDNGFRDPELLYLGGRFAASLGLRNEAMRFLSPLERQLCPDDSPAPAYCAAGMVLRALLPTGDEWQRLESRLNSLAAQSQIFATAFVDVTRDPAIVHLESLRAASPDQQDVHLHALLGVRSLAGDGHSTPEAPQFYRLANEANNAYHAQQPARARHSLERILMMDSDQPAVLRNLITIASEQQDIEAYERYWRRYVRVQLGRIVRREDADIAWEDLTRFYTRVAELMDRELDKSLNEVSTILPRPGFLPRWLEAIGALIWLEAAPKTRRVWQTGLEQGRAQQRHGYLAVMRFWLASFYPEFAPYLAVGNPNASQAALPSREARVQLLFNPTVRLMRRFLEWSRFNFALGQEDQRSERHRQTVLALASLVVRTPIHFCAADPELLKAVPREPGEEARPVRDLIRTACSYPLYALRLSKQLEAGDWQGIVDHFGDPDMVELLSPSIRMFLALAYCQIDQTFEGLHVACEAVTEMTADELNPETQNARLWEQVLHANIGLALDARRLPPGHGQVRGFKPPENLSDHDVLAGAWRAAIAAAEEGDIAKAQQVAHDLAAGAGTEQARADILATIDAIQAERDRVTAVWIELLRERLQRLPQNGPCGDARRDALDKVTRIIQQIKTSRTIDAAKALVQRGDFSGARTVIDNMSEETHELQELKQSLLKQINDMEQQAKDQAALNSLIEGAIQQAKAAVERGRFNDARNAVQRLPNQPEDVQQFKTNLLAQIAEAENQWTTSQREVDRLTRELNGKNINWQAVRNFASANNVDTANPIAYAQLLAVIDAQL